jgi:uncharacterized membrane protein YgcG
MHSCASFKLSTMYYDPLYGPEEVVLEVPSDVKIDTLSFSQLRWKLRTDNTFRWNFAQYAMNQPLSWYNTNFRYSYWRPFNSFDVYWNRHNYWYDWAFNYPFQWGWSWNRWGYWNRWNRPFYHWDSWYNGPWHNPSYNVIWNSSRENTNIAYVRGGRGSRFIDNGNSNIQNTISRRYNNPRPNVNNNNNVIDNIVNDLRSNGNRVRVYNNPNNVPNNNIIIRNNNSRPVVPNNSIRNNFNNSNINNSRPVYNNSSRGSNVNISRGSSSSVRSSGGSSGGSSRGGRGSNQN